MKKILIATDGSKFSKKAINNAADTIIDPERSAIRVVSVFEPPVPLGVEPFAMSSEYYDRLEEVAEQQALTAAEQAVEILKRRFPGKTLNISTTIEMGHPAEVVVNVAKAWGADVIVVGSHGHGFWGRLMLGSVSDGVVHHAPCSVMIARGAQ